MIHIDNEKLNTIRAGQTEKYKNMLKAEKKHFTEKSEALEYIRRINMVELLGISKTCKCLFHDDKNASASIFETYNGVYRYKCHSDRCTLKNTLDIFGVVCKLQDSTIALAAEYMFTALNITYEVDDIGNRFDLRTEMECNRNFLEYCANNNSTALKIIGQNIKVLVALYDIAEEQMAATGSSSVIIGASSNEIQQRMDRVAKISRALAILAYFELIERVPNYEIPTKRLSKLITYKNAECKNRIISQTRIPFIEKYKYEEKFNRLEQRAKEWQRKKYRTGQFDFNAVCEKDNVYLANKLFTNK